MTWGVYAARKCLYATVSADDAERIRIIAQHRCLSVGQLLRECIEHHLQMKLTMERSGKD
jgi:hypothetical protein